MSSSEVNETNRNNANMNKQDSKFEDWQNLPQNACGKAIVLIEIGENFPLYKNYIYTNEKNEKEFT